MLPTANRQPVSLAAVLTTSLAAVASNAGLANPAPAAPLSSRLALGPAKHAIVVLVDGLGALPLRARGGHARTLASRLGKVTTIDSGFPTTTAAALASLTTGAPAGRHGLVGYQVVDPSTRALFNHLSGWTGAPDPAEWQPLPTVFERAVGVGVRAIAVGPARYADSQLSRAILRGADYRAADSFEQRIARLRSILTVREPSITYVYVPDLDQTAHQYGWESDRWVAVLERVDAFVAELAAMLGRRDGLLVTGDHGVVDVPAHGHIYIEEQPELIEGVELVAGEPRCLQLHLPPGAGEGDVVRVAEAWRRAEGGRAWVATRAEAVEAGWFGADVDVRMLPRIGDVLVAARALVVYYDRRTAKPQSLEMIGQHGSLSPEEVKVPLIGFGAFELA